MGQPPISGTTSYGRPRPRGPTPPPDLVSDPEDRTAGRAPAPHDDVTRPKDGKHMRHRKNASLIAGAAAATLLLAACGGGDGDGDSSANGGGGGGGGEGRTMRLALNQTEEHPSYIALD